MRFAHRFFIDCLCIAALSGGFIACAQTGDDDSANTQFPGTGGTVGGGTGGMVAGGTGGMVAGGTGGMTAGGTGGMTAGGTGGMTAGGTGGTGAGTGGTGAGTGGTGAGTGGTSGGTGGMMAGDGGTAECPAAVMTDDPTTTAECAACLCDKCNAEITAMQGDDKAKALLQCGKTNNCSGSCCFCGEVCDMLGSNYRMGPCAEETEMAAGVPTPSDALTHGMMLSDTCAMAGTSCNKPVALSDCTKTNCATECPPVADCVMP